MSKRGISPLIATVLIVGFVFVMALMLMVFYRNTIERETTNIDKKVDVTNICLYGVDLEFDEACDYNSNLSIRIKNNKNSNISAFNFQVIGKDGSSFSTMINKTMVGGGSGRYHFVYDNDPSNVAKIVVVPIIVTSEGYGECAAKEIFINKVPSTCCFDMDSDGYDNCIPGEPAQQDEEVEDCDENDASAYRLGYLYPDADCDGHYAQDSVQVCYGDEPPNQGGGPADDWCGFSAVMGDDCDDSNAGAYPGLTIDYCGNGIDEDCDGIFYACPTCSNYQLIIGAGCRCEGIPHYEGYCCDDIWSSEECYLPALP